MDGCLSFLWMIDLNFQHSNQIIFFSLMQWEKIGKVFALTIKKKKNDLPYKEFIINYFT